MIYRTDNEIGCYLDIELDAFHYGIASCLIGENVPLEVHQNSKDFDPYEYWFYRGFRRGYLSVC